MPVAKFRAFAKRDDGATAIEYGLIAACIAVGIIVSFTFMGNNLASLFGTTEAGAGSVVQRAADSIE